MSVTAKRPAAPPAGAVALFATLAGAYVISQFLRNSIGVIAPDIAAEMNIPAAEIGVLSSAFFFAFAAVQLPLGVAIDRFGPKRCLLVCAMVVIVSALAFAAGRTPAELTAARIVMGVGTSCYLIAPLALYARRFSPDRFAMLAGLHMSVGTLGTLLATAPLAAAAATLGWRAAFVVVAAVMGVAALLMALVVREPAPAAPASAANPKFASGRGGYGCELRNRDTSRETLAESILGIRAAMRVPSVGRLFLMQMATYSSFVLFVGLWGGPYLSHVYGYDLTERGNLLLVPAITQIFGLALYGWSDRVFGGYRAPVAIGAFVTAGLFVLLAFFGTLPHGPLLAWLVAFGALAAFTPVVHAHSKALFPPALVGRGMTLLNMGSMGGVFVSQSISGLAIDLFAANNGVYPLASYRLVFALQAAFLAVAAAFYLTARDPLADSRRRASGAI